MFKSIARSVYLHAQKEIDKLNQLYFFSHDEYMRNKDVNDRHFRSSVSLRDYAIGFGYDHDDYFFEFTLPEAENEKELLDLRSIAD